MEILGRFNGMYDVINDFGQVVRRFSEYDDAFDFLSEIEF